MLTTYKCSAPRFVNDSKSGCTNGLDTSNNMKKATKYRSSPWHLAEKLDRLICLRLSERKGILSTNLKTMTKLKIVIARRVLWVIRGSKIYRKPSYFGMQALKLANWSKNVIVEFYLDDYLTVTFVCAARDPIVHYFAHDIIKSVCLFRSMMQVKVPTKANSY